MRRGRVGASWEGGDGGGDGCNQFPLLSLEKDDPLITAHRFPVFISDYVLLQQRIPNGSRMRPPFVLSPGLLAEGGLPF